MSPEAAMREALAAARKASGRTFPNPPVGAVVVRGVRILGRGFTRPAGGPHAEVVAIEAAARRFGAAALRGAAMAVTLEPCNHRGRTGPCTDAILGAGIARVYVGHRDPHRLVGGRGLRRLRSAGVRVVEGVLETSCREQHRGFLSVVERGRPFVVLKLAASLDGRIATASGESRWITGPAARAEVHRLRGRVDAVLVGSATALADDPELTARRGSRIVHRPLAVVLDSRLRLPPNARAIAVRDPGGVVVIGSRNASPARREALERAGVRVLLEPAGTRGLSPRGAARRLARLGVTEILVEGGGEVAAAWLRAGLVDELHWFVSTALLGGDAKPALGALGIRRLSGAIALHEPVVRRFGADLYLRGCTAERGVL